MVQTVHIPEIPQCSSWVSLLTRPLLFYDRCQFIAAVLVAALVVDNSGMYTAGFAGDVAIPCVPFLCRQSSR